MNPLITTIDRRDGGMLDREAGITASENRFIKQKPRVITPARREQNREAQRAYRQRQKDIKSKRRQGQSASRSNNAAKVPRPLAPQPVNRVEISSSLTPGRPERLGAAWRPSWHEHAHSFLAANGLNPPAAEDWRRSQTTIRGRRSEKRHITDDSPPDRSSGQTCSIDELPSVDRFPSPVSSNLQTMQITLFNAVLQNALSLGFDMARVAECGADFMSPFYRADADLRTDPHSLFIAPGAAARSLPENLRPTMAQILVPHHASLDLIPIPLLRDRAILLSVTRPGTCDLFELKVDIYHRGGLMVWTSEEQRGDKGLGGRWQRNGMEGRDWLPWNGRCWEAAPWFLRKWALATDGDDGELGKQSRWWKTVREAREGQGPEREIGG